MTTPTPTPPGTFLIPVKGQPAVVDTAGRWHQIMETEGIIVEDSTGNTKDVSVNASVIRGTWSLPFSSTKNLTAFGNFNVDALENNAWVGDIFDSGVMALALDTPDTTPRGLGDIFTAFGIIGDQAATDIPEFLESLGLNALQATVHNPAIPAATDQLNALWCITTPTTYEAVLRMSFDLDTKSAQITMQNAIKWINTQLGLSMDTTSVPQLPPVLITLTRMKFYGLQDLFPTNSYAMNFQITIEGYTCSVDFSVQQTIVLLRPPPNSTVTSIYESIKKIFVSSGDVPGLDSAQMPSGGSQDNTGADNLFAEFFSHIALWYVQLSKDVSDAGDTSISWGVAILAGWEVNKQPIVVGLSYDSKTSKFVGKLLLSGDVPDALDQRLPSYDRRLAIAPATLKAMGLEDISALPPSIDLWDLFGDHGSPPKNLPHFITAAQVSYQTLTSTDSSTSNFMFYMDISSTPGTDPDPAAAPSGFVWSDISVLATLTRSKPTKPPNADTQTSTSLVISSSFYLYPNDPTSTLSPAFLQVQLEYDNSAAGSDWTLQGSLDNLSVALLANYFDESCRDGAMAILGNITLASLDMFYTYTSGSASSFLISAVLQLGGLELDLSYQYVSSLNKGQTAAAIQWPDSPPPGVKLLQTTGWAFEAYLRVNSPAATIASIAESIVPSSSAKIPTFVGGISVAPKNDPTNSPVKLLYTGGDDKGSILMVWLSIGVFNLTFIQYRSPAANGATSVTKRIMRISIDQIPLLDDVPLINQLPQPFDYLTYMWVEDDDPKTTGTDKAGFSRALLAGAVAGSSPAIANAINVNSELHFEGIPEIQFKEISQTPTNDDLILQAGHHFVVIANGAVVLDHVFNATAADTTPPAPLASTAESKLVMKAASPPTTGAEAPVTKGNTDKKAGPLSISGLSLQYKNGSLFVGVDATLVLGPLTFAVLGFTIELEINKVKLDDLSALITNNFIHVSIHGLEVAVSKPPLTLGGAFVYETGTDNAGDTYESYRGGVSVGFEAWDILAVGEYRIVTMPNKSQFRSVFVYGRLDGPLVELEFATISGVRVGFGYNSTVFLPSADLLYTFPFISNAAASGTGNDPMKVLNAMITPVGNQPAYVSTKEGSVWFCAGMTITCFDCVSLTAVLLFDIDTTPQFGGVIVALLADGVFQMEPAAPPELTLVYVEVLIKVELNFIDGYIAADAVLAPASHVYVPQAHLTGGASFYQWFAPNSHAGDWVVTIGGYNKAYTPPSHYPVPTRLGLNFTIGDNIQIVGVAYAAITPKCAMAGGSLHMSLGVGIVSAYCNIVLDVFINFKPFYFIAEISLSVGVECDIDILFIHIHVSVSIGADLTIWGPREFGGIAHVDFWFFGFDIHFGGGLNKEDPLLLPEFYEVVRTPGPASTTADTDPYIAQHKYSIESGLAPTVPTPSGTDFPNTGASTEWTVQPNLQIRIDCDFTLSGAHIIVNETDRTKDYPINLPPLTSAGVPTTPPDIWSFPMQNATPITSTLEIRIYSLEGDTPSLMPGFTAELVLKNASQALWSEYKSDNDPLKNLNPTILLNGDNPTKLLVQAVRIFSPAPFRAKSPIVDFDATAAMAEQLPYNLAPPLPQQTAFLSQLPANSPAPWSQLEDEWSGKVNPQYQGINKSDVRGDDGGAEPGGGLLGLCSNVLGWANRPAVDKVKNAVVVPADGRMEWQLKSNPPLLLIKELADYYPALPMWTSATA